MKKFNFVCLIIYLQFCLQFLFVYEGKTYARDALVVGITQYNQKALKNAVNDAKLISKGLKKLGWNVRVLNQPTSKKLKNGIANFISSISITKSETVLFYFAGHGFQYLGENYMVPSDIHRFPNQLIEKSLSISEITYLMKSIEQPKIIILDACRSASLGKDTLAISTGLNSQTAPPNTLISYATSPGNVAFDGPDFGNSPFAASLYLSLSKNKKFSEVFRETRLRTMQLTGGKQVPWESSSLLSDVSLVSNSKDKVKIDPQNHVFSTYLSPKVTNEITFNLKQTLGKIYNYRDAVRYLIKLAKLADDRSFFQHDSSFSEYPRIVISETPHEDREDVIKSLIYLLEGEMNMGLHSIGSSLQRGSFHPKCRKSGTLDYSCMDSSRRFIFEPNLKISLRLAKLAHKNNIYSILLAKHFRHGWQVKKDLLKAYDLYMAYNNQGGWNALRYVNEMVQEELIELGHDITIDGDFGPTSCSALKTHTGKTKCSNPISRDHLAQFVSVLQIKLP